MLNYTKSLNILLDIYKMLKKILFIIFSNYSIIIKLGSKPFNKFLSQQKIELNQENATSSMESNTDKRIVALVQGNDCLAII